MLLSALDDTFLKELVNVRRLSFDYYMQISYTKQVAVCHYTIKCMPRDTDMQHLNNINIRLKPEDCYAQGEDSFGNKTIYGSIEELHKKFELHVCGEVMTGLDVREREENPSSLGKYRYSHGLNAPGAALRSYYESVCSDISGSAYERSTMLMHRLYRDFTYEKNVTDVSTTAGEAWNLGRGVCQDYAHILTSLCHMDNIPARYVAGMMEGEGSSHAWVEIYYNGYWYPIDPTNDCIVTDSYIKLGQGRDASDCAINRGIIKGGGAQTQLIRVCVKEI